MSTRRDPLTPGNKLYRTVLIETVDGSTGATTPIVSGTVTAFLATTKDPDATAADASLSVSATHVGVASPTSEQFPLGTWLIAFPASTATLLDSLFDISTGAYLYVVRSGESRVYEHVKYKRDRAAVLG